MALVLIAEANEATASFVASAVERAGHQTLTTSSSTEALAICQERRPDLVLVNYFLAEGDGLAFLDGLRRLAPQASAVMTTGLGNEIMAREAMRRGAADYVVKGRTYFQDLPGLVDDLLERRRSEAARAASLELAGRLEAQAELAGWLDHNFKNILSAVSGALSLIDFGNPAQTDDKRREYLADGLASLRTAVDLLGDLSRMTRAGGDADAKAVLVSAVADEAWRAVSDRLKGSPAGEFSVGPKILDSATFINDCRDLPPQRVVRQDLSTILEALIKNALEAVAQARDPRILVRASRRGELLAVSVEDNGRGMDEKVRRHAFEPLFSTKGQVGVGLSLTTVMALVIRHQGAVSIDSEIGRGTRIEFTWRVDPA
jgi:signal transduction histidine kinase